MYKIITYLRPREGDDPMYVPVIGDISYKVGEEITIFLNKTELASGFVKSCKAVRLQDINEKVLKKLPEGYHVPEVFWSRTERAYGGGLPGEAFITFVSISSQPVKKAKKQKVVKVEPVVTEVPPVESRGTSEDFESRVKTYSLKDLLS